MKRIIIFISLGLLLNNCANTSLEPDSYDRGSTQKISNVLYGEVVAVKKVTVEGDTMSGTLVGGVVGAAAGSGISDSRPESEIGAILGGAIGASIGGNLSKSLKSVDGIQITINMDDGRTISVVQEVAKYKFNVGDLVEVISTNGKTRVSPTGIN